MKLIQEPVAPPCGRVILMRVEGPIVRSSAVPLREFVEERAPSTHLLLDVTDASPFGEEAIHQLLYASSQIMAAGGQFELLDKSGNLNLALRGTGFEDIFKAHGDLKSALKSFDSPNQRKHPFSVSLAHYLHPGYQSTLENGDSAWGLRIK